MISFTDQGANLFYFWQLKGGWLQEEGEGGGVIDLSFLSQYLQ